MNKTFFKRLPDTIKLTAYVEGLQTAGEAGPTLTSIKQSALGYMPESRALVPRRVGFEIVEKAAQGDCHPK